MEHKIGEIITLLDGRKAEVVESDIATCDGCVYQETYCLNLRLRNCGRRLRTDHKNVIYKEIKEK